MMAYRYIHRTRPYAQVCTDRNVSTEIQTDERTHVAATINSANNIQDKTRHLISINKAVKPIMT